MSPLAISLLLLVAGSFFLWTMWQRFGILFKLKGDDRFDNPIDRTDALVQFGFGQRRLLDEPVAGIMHVLIFAAFMVLGAREIQLFGIGFSRPFHLPLLGPGSALSGPYGLACNVTAVGAILGCCIAWYKRLFQKPDRLTLSWEAHFILAMITVLMLTEFFFDGSALAVANQRDAWRPVTSMAANFLAAFDLSPAALVKIAALRGLQNCVFGFAARSGPRLDVDAQLLPESADLVGDRGDICEATTTASIKVTQRHHRAFLNIQRGNLSADSTGIEHGHRRAET